MENEGADLEVRKIEELKHNHGAQQAYAALKKDFDDFASTHSADQVKAYWDKVSGSLSQDKVLPDLAIAWGEVNREKIARDGSITRYDLKTVPRFADSSALDKRLSEALLNQFDKVRDESTDIEGSVFTGFHEKDAISKDDLKERLESIENDRKKQVAAEKAQSESRTWIKPLVETRDGDFSHSLFSVLDPQKNGHFDNIVSKSDLEEFLKQYEILDKTGSRGGAFTPENKRFVEKLAKEWDSESVRQLREKRPWHLGDDWDSVGGQFPGSAVTYGNISIKSLTAAGGFSGIGEMLRSYLPAPETSAPAVDQPQKLAAGDRADNQKSADSNQAPALKPDALPQTSSNQPDAEKPAAGEIIASKSIADRAAVKAEQLQADSQLDRLPKEARVHRSENGGLYDLARNALTARARLTGEATDRDAVFHELNRIMVLNGFPAAHLEGKSHISSADLPSAWSEISLGQDFRLYEKDKLAAYQKPLGERSAAPHRAAASVPAVGEYYTW